MYVFYQAKVSTLCEPEVKEICKNLKKLHYNFNSLPDATDPLLEGTSLFELYLAIQRFSMLGLGLCPMDYDTFHIKNFHQWFHGGVATWLDIAVYKALQRIEKAVELDKLVHEDNTLKCSSSAVDTISIFYQVRITKNLQLKRRWNITFLLFIRSIPVYSRKGLSSLCPNFQLCNPLSSWQESGLGNEITIQPHRTYYDSSSKTSRTILITLSSK